jgi:glycosyltransferase involved in cell wall biosynthesis
MCVGDGPNLEKIKNSFPPEYKNLIKFPGRQENVESIINMFDIGVLTCNTIGHAEGISNSIMEYMASGKPVIATDSGGNKEIVVDRETGYIINPFAVDELTETIHLLLNDTKKKREMGEAGKRKIINEFDSQKMANCYLGLYKKLLK